MSLLLGPAASATAQDRLPEPRLAPQVTPEAPTRWPEALRHRNARYANLQRVQDLDGDGHERVLRDLVLTRTDDVLGDREQDFRVRAAGKIPPLAVADARLTRLQGERDDRQQLIVAKLTAHRRHAELRRFRDLTGDGEVLQAYNLDVLHFGPTLVSEQEHIADSAGPDPVREDYLTKRFPNVRHVDEGERQLETAEDLERNEERALERFEDRGLGRLGDDDDRRADEALDRESERAEERADADADRRLDQVMESADRLMEDAERDLEREAEQIDSATERDLERQIQREEESLSGPGGE